MNFALDVNGTTVSLNGTSLDDGPKLIWNAENLGDGDHQFYVFVGSLQKNGSLAVDYFEYVLSLLYVATRIVLQQFCSFQG